MPRKPFWMRAQNIRKHPWPIYMTPDTMPPELVKAHHKLDAAVDAAYSKRKFSGDTDRVAFLFDLYQQIASPLESKKTVRKRKLAERV